MDSKFLERLADKAGFETGGGRRGDGVIGRLDHLEAFAALVAEECAAVVEAEAVDAIATGNPEDRAYNLALSHASDAIRAKFRP